METPWEVVESSNLAAARWSDNESILTADHTLEVMFRDGSVYEYRGVPREVFDGLLKASSKGQYHWRNIRDRFPCTKLSVGSERRARKRA